MITINTYKAHIDRNISTRKLAELTGLSKSTINNIDCGKTSPNLQQLEAIAKALDLKMTELFKSEYK
ncbi:Cro/C1-type helix-turn-helix DNA-binding protein [Lachnotalea glycerini]|uniref:Cro/C1-type helix-turn-helix DNA-binding protein n=1 Tax=Lachnotalea glycerini TaxID=1763509 RepID=A0A255IM09_9FIRM|nr:helix-turn-helix transcriptional regulator [Lachnotalea glycerini]PXV87333.1 Cro/C1-type helix-turn-helix DNA-binding protein [Lachnotalea glycerini]RDY27510.1 XRE family transcriptional regulator [Lachnotalea glycerini]